MTPIEEFEKELASEKLGIYYPHPNDLGSEILIALQAEIKNFLQRNLQFFELDNLEFHCINSESINGCATCCSKTISSVLAEVFSTFHILLFLLFLKRIHFCMTY
jgi:hypothetical protein